MFSFSRGSRYFFTLKMGTALVAWCLGVQLVQAQEVNAQLIPKQAEHTPNATKHREQLASVTAFLKQYCFNCHSKTKTEGKLQLDELPLSDRTFEDRIRWDKVLRRVTAGEMPPKSQPRPLPVDLDSFQNALRQLVLTEGQQNLASEGRTVARRLNRIEYENTIRDLLGIEIDLQELLPIDGSANGFDNVSEALHTSSFLMDRYLEAADRSLNLAIANSPRPPLLKKRYSLKDTHQVKSTTESVFRKLEGDALVMFSSSPWQSVVVSPFYPQERGRYRFRISAGAYQSGEKPVTFRVDAGPMLMATKNHMVGYFDAPSGTPVVTEFIDHLEARSTIRISPFGLAPSQEVHKIGADKYEGSGLRVDWIDVEGPIHETWPPPSHRRIFGDLPQAPNRSRNDSNRVEVISQAPDADAHRILESFCTRAYRRSVQAAEIQPLLKLFQGRRDQGASFEQAIRVALKGALVSPDFLFLREKPGKLDDFALASRLSYFLWSTMPDDELLSLAAAGNLSQPEILHLQVERLLESPKARAFTENFTGQWLGLRDVDATEPDRRLYPEYDDMLRAAMVQETHLFFQEVLRQDLSVTQFVDSDFTFLNERLAKHYRVSGVTGHAFSKVKLPPGSHRGGVMTMASVLKVTANGTNTSPIIRGAWVLDKILGTPPTPPPAGVPAIEPDIRGATTIREQLAKHRQIESCASCHELIDPPGFALESFDVIGGWRDYYRSVGRGEPVTIEGRQMHYYRGLPVDSADRWHDGRTFTNVDELKQLLLTDKEQLARAFLNRLLTYATGCAPRPSDQAEIQSIIDKIRIKNYGLRTMIHELTRSSLFQSK